MGEWSLFLTGVFLLFTKLNVIENSVIAKTVYESQNSFYPQSGCNMGSANCIRRLTSDNKSLIPKIYSTNTFASKTSLWG
jgi:hypothetical protein